MRHFVLFLFLVSLFPAVGRSSVGKNPDSLISFSKKQLGVKYKWAHSSPKTGFDCSGFIYYVFGHFNIKVPRASMAYEKMGRVVPPDSCRPGDIIVFTGTDPKIRKAGHVGMIISQPGEAITFIHSSSSAKKSGVKISSFKDSPGYKKRYIRIVRVLDTN